MASTAELILRVEGKDEASKVLKGVDDSASGLGKTLGSVSQIAGGFLAANVVAGAGQKLIGMFSDSVNAAKDLGESMNAVNKIFGTQSQTILDWGKNNATSVGLSQRAFNELATPLGAMLKNSGIEDFSGATIELTKRASDMASVFNVDVDEAMTALQAGLRGESDPLERFGVGLSAAKVEARALADTGKATAASLTDQEKATARLAIIFEQTASVAGDFADTSDDLANKTRISQARQEELAATIGQKLMPIQLKITEAKLAMVDVLATKVIPILEELYAKHWPAVSAAIQAVVDFVSQYWPTVSDVIAFYIDFVMTKIEGLIQSFKAIVEIVTSVVSLISAIFRGDWATVWQEMQDIAGAALDLLLGYVKWIFGNIPEVLLGLAGDAASAAGKWATDIFDAIVRQLEKLPGKMAELGRNAAQSFLNSISVAGVSVGDVTGFLTGHAAGGHASGWAVVGERGPELVQLPRGSQVYSNQESMSLARGSGGGGVTVQIFNPVIHGGGDLRTLGGDVGYSILQAMKSRGLAA